MRIFLVISAFLVVCTGVLASGSTGTVTGVVYDANNEQPIEGAKVTVLGTKLWTVSIDGGRFLLLNVPAGQVTLRASFVGLTPVDTTVTVTADAGVQVDIPLSPPVLIKK